MSFPASPSVGQQATEGGRLYQWTGTVWDLVATVTGHASQHAANGSDPITPASIGAANSSHTHTASQVSDFATQAALYGPVTSVNGLTGAVTVAPVTDGSKGDIVVSNSGATWTIAANAVVTADIADNAVTNAKILSVAASKVTGLPSGYGRVLLHG